MRVSRSSGLDTWARKPTVARRIVRTAASIVLLPMIAGCALPLVPATVPLAVAVWGTIGLEVLSGIGKGPAPGEPEPQALMLGQVRQVLTPAAVADGRIDAEGVRVDDLAAGLSSLGLTPRQVGEGNVVVVQVAVGEMPGDTAPRRLFVPMLRGGLVVNPGDIVEARVRRERPGELVRVRPAGTPEGDCRFVDLAGGRAEPDRLQSRELGDVRLSATLHCKGIEDQGWVRPAAFWVKSSGPLPTAAASLLFFYRQHSEFWIPRIVLAVSVAEQRFELNNGQCRVLLLPAVRQAVHVANRDTGLRLRRSLYVDVAADERVVVEFAFDATQFAKDEPLFGLRHLFDDDEPPSRYVHFSARPAAPGEVCSGSLAPLVVPGP
jgi:hypothetical protein